MKFYIKYIWHIDSLVLYINYFYSKSFEKLINFNISRLAAIPTTPTPKSVGDFPTPRIDTYGLFSIYFCSKSCEKLINFNMTTR